MFDRIVLLKGRHKNRAFLVRLIVRVFVIFELGVFCHFRNKLDQNAKCVQSNSYLLALRSSLYLSFISAEK